MSDVWTWVERQLHPPGVRQKNRRALYRIISRIAGQAADDAAESKRQFYARVAGSLPEHGESKGIPRLPSESDVEYRGRLASACSVLRRTGETRGLQEFLDDYVPGRWRITDSPRDFFRVGSGRIGKTPIGSPANVTVYVTDLAKVEQLNIEAFLDWFLGADIAYRVASGGYSAAASPLGLADLRGAGGSAWVEWHLGKAATAAVDLLPDDAFGIGRGKGVGKGRIYRGAGVYVVVRCSKAHRRRIVAALALLIDSSIEIVFEEGGDE